MKIKGAIFDCDGTLIDSLGFWRIFYEMFGERYFNDKSFWPAEEDDHAMRTQNTEFLGRLLHSKYGVGENAEEIRDWFYDRLGWYYNEVVQLKPGVRELLEHLKCLGVKMCIASASEIDMVKGILRRHGVLDYFSDVVSCTEAGAGKDKPDVFLLAEKRLGTPHGETFVFEDSTLAIQTAKKAGFPVVGVYDANTFGQNIAKESADLYVDNGSSFVAILPHLEA